MKRMIVAAFLAASAGCANMDEPGRLWPTLGGSAPIVIAHRGASGYLPEHTLEAYALAIDQGADAIEPDLVITKDGVLIARHERYLSGSTDVASRPEFAARKRFDAFLEKDEGRRLEDWWVEDFTFAELRTLRARQPRANRSAEYDGLYVIPTFAEILALAARKSKEAGRPVGVYPETKHPDYFSAIGLDFKARLVSALRDYEAGPVYIQSFVPEILQRLKGETDAKLVQLVEDRNGSPSVALADLAAYADGVGPQKSLLASGEFIAEARRLGLFIHPWTYRLDQLSLANADEAGLTARERGVAEMAHAFAELGVDGLFTDFPDAGLDARREAQDMLNARR
jgi:glycerophosphoryl diester phosphodiesterase